MASSDTVVVEMDEVLGEDDEVCFGQQRPSAQEKPVGRTIVERPERTQMVVTRHQPTRLGHDDDRQNPYDEDPRHDHDYCTLYGRYDETRDGVPRRSRGSDERIEDVVKRT